MLYIYIHRRYDDGKIFYVGRGKAQRPWAFKARSKAWKAIADKHGITVGIVAECLSEEDADQKEKALHTAIQRTWISLDKSN